MTRVSLVVVSLLSLFILPLENSTGTGPRLRDTTEMFSQPPSQILHKKRDGEKRRGEAFPSKYLFPQSHALSVRPTVPHNLPRQDGRTDGLPLRPIAKQLACSLALLPSRLLAPSPLARARGVGACIF